MSVSGLSLTHPSAHPNVLPLLFWVFSLSSHLENGNVFPAEDAVPRNSKLLLLGALVWCWVLGLGFWAEVGRRDLLPSSGFQVVTHPVLIKPADSQRPLVSFIGSISLDVLLPGLQFSLWCTVQNTCTAPSTVLLMSIWKTEEASHSGKENYYAFCWINCISF